MVTDCFPQTVWVSFVAKEECWETKLGWTFLLWDLISYVDYARFCSSKVIFSNQGIWWWFSQSSVWPDYEGKTLDLKTCSLHSSKDIIQGEQGLCTWSFLSRRWCGSTDRAPKLLSALGQQAMSSLSLRRFPSCRLPGVSSNRSSRKGHRTL